MNMKPELFLLISFLFILLPGCIAQPEITVPETKEISALEVELFLLDATSKTVYQVHHLTGSVIREINLREEIQEPAGIAVSEENLFALDKAGNKIEVYLKETGEFIESFQVQEGLESDLSTSENSLWAINSEKNKLIELSFSGEQLNEIEFQAENFSGLAFNTGALFASNSESNEIKVINSETGEEITSFSSPEEMPSALASCGDTLWISTLKNNRTFIASQYSGTPLQYFDSPSENISGMDIYCTQKSSIAASQRDEDETRDATSIPRTPEPPATPPIVPPQPLPVQPIPVPQQPLPVQPPQIKFPQIPQPIQPNIPRFIPGGQAQPIPIVGGGAGTAIQQFPAFFCSQSNRTDCDGSVLERQFYTYDPVRGCIPDKGRSVSTDCAKAISYCDLLGANKIVNEIGFCNEPASGQAFCDFAIVNTTDCGPESELSCNGNKVLEKVNHCEDIGDLFNKKAECIEEKPAIIEDCDAKFNAICINKRNSLQTKFKCAKNLGCTEQKPELINCGAGNKLKCDGDYIVEYGKACDPTSMLCVKQDPVEKDDYCTDLYSCPSSNEVKVTFRKCSEGGCIETGSKTKECKTTFTCSGTTKLGEACDRCAAGAAANSSLTIPKPVNTEEELNTLCGCSDYVYLNHPDCGGTGDFPVST